MPTIRELVAVLRQRDGVEAAVILGRDGLVIDGQAAPGTDAESIAAFIPSVIAAADDLGRHGAGGTLTTAVLEYPTAIALVSVLAQDTLLLVLARPGDHVGPLLFDVRRHREQIAALV